MENFTASSKVCEDTASGVSTSTLRFVFRTTFCAQTNCMGVLPSPQSAKIAARPWHKAQSTNAA